VRRTVLYSGLAFSLASLGFSLGSWSAQREMALQLAENDAVLAELRDDVARGTGGVRTPAVVAAGGADSQSAMIEEIKRQLQSEMGLMPVRLLRERRDSFVELNAYDNVGKTSYGTAGYLGNGYFITVKHGVRFDPYKNLPDGCTRTSAVDNSLVTGTPSGKVEAVWISFSTPFLPS
jgi:hypothetical protein